MARFLFRFILPVAIFFAFPPLYRAWIVGDPAIPDHAHWTVTQCQKYWDARGKDLLVISPDNEVAHTPTAEEADPKKFIVEKNGMGSEVGTPASGAYLTVVLKSAAGTNEVERMSLVNHPALSQVHRHYSRLLVTDYNSVTGYPEELNAYESWKHEQGTLRYQVPWESGPIYEGGSVGVVINGALSSLISIYAVQAFGALLAAVAALTGYALELRMRIRKLSEPEP